MAFGIYSIMDMRKVGSANMMEEGRRVKREQGVNRIKEGRENTSRIEGGRVQAVYVAKYMWIEGGKRAQTEWKEAGNEGGRDGAKCTKRLERDRGRQRKKGARKSQAWMEGMMEGAGYRQDG